MGGGAFRHRRLDYYCGSCRSGSLLVSMYDLLAAGYNARPARLIYLVDPAYQSAGERQAQRRSIRQALGRRPTAHGNGDGENFQ